MNWKSEDQWLKKILENFKKDQKEFESWVKNIALACMNDDGEIMAHGDYDELESLQWWIDLLWSQCYGCYNNSIELETDTNTFTIRIYRNDNTYDELDLNIEDSDLYNYANEYFWYDWDTIDYNAGIGNSAFSVRLDYIKRNVSNGDEDNASIELPLDQIGKSSSTADVETSDNNRIITDQLTKSRIRARLPIYVEVEYNDGHSADSVEYCFVHIGDTNSCGYRTIAVYNNDIYLIELFINQSTWIVTKKVYKFNSTDDTSNWYV